MKNVTVQLPDSIDLSEAEIQQLVLTSVAARQERTGSANTDSNTLLVHLPFPAEADDIRNLIGLYYAERATQLVDDLWDEKGWTADTMHEWLREHMRTAHGRPAA
ncbi:hypothetical protein ACFQ48_08340 [Hymenobacter caeli]|uniref:Uncharacterized protein n=1 Tax=Hymenobacter caeli TaxID=2735894 RepID=A0ABX2FPR3_9BACT|nr:hypothetical protein [Hymenobacter caeli]NRT19135.1 hypothetical protein [Hymenobacter caeli]